MLGATSRRGELRPIFERKEILLIGRQLVPVEVLSVRQPVFEPVGIGELVGQPEIGLELPGAAVVRIGSLGAATTDGVLWLCRLSRAPGSRGVVATWRRCTLSGWRSRTSRLWGLGRAAARLSAETAAPA